MEASVSAPARKNRLLKVGKKPCIQRTYSANLRIRRRFGTVSRAGVPGAAERSGRALPEEIKACLLEEGVAAAAPCGERERAKARTGYAPTARCGTGLVRTTVRGAGLLDDSSADVGFSAALTGGAAWPLMVHKSTHQHNARTSWTPRH